MPKNVSIFTGSAWESIVGPPGKDGVDGKDGSGVTIKGTATTYPPDASPTIGDMWLTGDPVPAGAPAGTQVGDGLVWTGTQWNNVGGIRGPAGKDGADGANGVPGQDGQAGADGVGFTFRGEWDGSSYAVNDVVTYQGTTYIMVAGDGDEDITDTSAWSPLAKSGVGFKWKPDYIFGDDLDNNDVIPLLGSTYVASGMPTARSVDLSFATRAMNPIPLPGGGELRLMAKAGEDGTIGADGADGAKGDKGDDGADGRSVAVTKSPTQPATAALGDFWIEE